MVDQVELHKMAHSANINDRIIAANNLRDFAALPDKQLAWEDMHRLTHDNEIVVRVRTLNALGCSFRYIPGKEQAWEDMHRIITRDRDDVMQGVEAADALGFSFPYIPNKQQAWEDLHQLTLQQSMMAADISFSFHLAIAFENAFPYIPDKKQAWEDFRQLILKCKNEPSILAICINEAAALYIAFPHIPDADKIKAWDDLHRFVLNGDSFERCYVAKALGLPFPHKLDKKQAWEDLKQLMKDIDPNVRLNAVYALGLAFPYIPDKEQAWSALTRLSQTNDDDLRTFANFSLGRACIFKATEAHNSEDFKREIENAIYFFERSSTGESNFIPANFCLPFYQSFYTITFKKQEAEKEVQKYLEEAKSATEGSESKEILLEAIENLAEALRESQRSSEIDLDAMKRDLNAYRRYCDRAVELLDTTEEKAPGATRLIRKGLPIIDQRIKETLGEIQEKTAEVCRHAQGTSLEPLGYEINQTGKNLLLVKDIIGLEKGVENLLIVVSNICDKMPSEERGDACELLKKAKAEPYIEDRIDLINIVLGKIPAHIRTIRLEEKIDALIVSLKPGIRRELTITVGAEVFGTGVQHVITIPLQEICYPELTEDLAKIKEKNTNKLASLPQRLAHKVKDYLIRTKKEDLLK